MVLTVVETTGGCSRSGIPLSSKDRPSLLLSHKSKACQSQGPLLVSCSISSQFPASLTPSCTPVGSLLHNLLQYKTSRVTGNSVSRPGSLPGTHVGTELLRKWSDLSACCIVPPHNRCESPATKRLSIDTGIVRRTPDYVTGFYVVMKHARKFLNMPPGQRWSLIPLPVKKGQQGALGPDRLQQERWLPVSQGKARKGVQLPPGCLSLPFWGHRAVEP